MEITIKVHDSERIDCLKALQQLNDLPHVRFMSHAVIAETSGIKPTKLRAVLADVVEQGLAERYQATENPSLQRYYYTITEKGKSFMAAYDGEQ